MSQLLSIFISLIIGYCIKNLPISNHKLNTILSNVVIFMLLVMGYEFGSLNDNIISQLINMAKLIAILISMLLFFNFTSILIFIHKLNKIYQADSICNKKSYNKLNYFIDSVKYLFFVLLGVTINHIVKIKLVYLSQIIGWLLFIVMFIIGHQLRSQEMSLRQIIFNLHGFYLAIIVAISSLFAGVMTSWIINIPLNYALMLSSGFGWYSLSGILNTNLVNSNFGMCAFLIDFLRELLAIILFPVISRLFPIVAIGYCGATAMDFSLPVIKEHLGSKAVPLAISSGVLLSVSVPILVPIFAKLTLI